MATNRNATRTTLAGRAAIAWLVCAPLLFCGCRSPWRSWRNDEPSLEQLLMQPGPWDAEARLAQESPTGRAASAQGSDTNHGRANPYAARDAASRDTASGRTENTETDGARTDDERATRAARAEFEAAYAAAPPHLRGLLKRQWDATQARHAKQLAGGLGTEGDPDATADSEQDVDARTAVARGARSDAAAVSLRLSDEDSAEPAADEEADAAELGEVPRVRKRGPVDQHTADKDPESSEITIRELKPKALRPSGGEGAVTYSLKDTDDRSNEADTSLEELAPPPSKKLPRQVVHAQPVDTGAGDDVLVKPVAAAPKRAANQPASHVTTASAEAEVAPAAATAAAVAPAIAEEQVAAQAKELNWRDHLREALRQLEAEPENENENSTESPAEQLHRQAASRMLRLALGELDPALQPIEGLQTHEQEFFRHHFQALYDAIDPKGNPVLSRRWTLALDSHRKALGHLSAVSNLEIKNANFCTDVHSYGVINKFTSPHFKPNQELLLYCELENFAAEAVKDGYETQLQGSYEIVDASGRRVADMLLPEDADICRNQRRDYFIAYRIYMPQKIGPGRYQLRLTIEDMKGRKFGQTSMDFQIVP